MSDPQRQRVVIVARTRMGDGVCIGGMIERTGKLVRLMPGNRSWQPADSAFRIGDIWEVNLRPRPHAKPPHVEDHNAWKAEKAGTIPDLVSFITSKASLMMGEPAGLFTGRVLQRPGGSGYIDTTRPLPEHSVGFWIPPRDLTLVLVDGKPKYRLDSPTPFRLAYVGFETPIPIIEAGSLVRLSLARPWMSAEDIAERKRCSVQLSGWY